MNVLYAAAAAILFILLAAGIGIVAAWMASACYPWRRCGRCGRDEWRIFRGKSHLHPEKP